MRTDQPRSASSAPRAQTVVDRPTPPFGCSTARTTGFCACVEAAVGAATEAAIAVTLVMTLPGHRAVREGRFLTTALRPSIAPAGLRWAALIGVVRDGQIPSLEVASLGDRGWLRELQRDYPGTRFGHI